MKRQVSSVAIVLTLGATCGVGAQSRTSSDELLQRVVDVLRWKHYWEPEDTPRYYPGSEVRVLIVRSLSEVEVFAANVGIHLHFKKVSEGALPRPVFGDYSAGDTNESLAGRYLRRVDAPDCFPMKPPEGESSRPGVQLPNRRICRQGEPLGEIELERRTLIVPRMMPPAYDRAEPNASEVAALRRGIESRVADELGPGGAAAVTVPRFLASDPYVYVLIDFGASRGRAVSRFGESGEAWFGDVLFFQRGAGEVENAIRRVLENRLLSFLVTRR